MPMLKNILAAIGACVLLFYGVFCLWNGITAFMMTGRFSAAFIWPIVIIAVLLAVGGIALRRQGRQGGTR